MSIKGLIKGETIKVDNHSAGQAIDIDDRGLHLHKRFNKACKKHGKAEAIIPLNEGNITFRNVDNKESHYVCIRLADGALNGGCLPPCR